MKVIHFPKNTVLLQRRAVCITADKAVGIGSPLWCNVILCNIMFYLVLRGKYYLLLCNCATQLPP